MVSDFNNIMYTVHGTHAQSCLLHSGVDPKSNDQKPFLAWQVCIALIDVHFYIQLQLILFMQTWDLLRLMFYGFKGLCGSFTGQHGQYYVVPVRINGSAIESLFSRFKYDAGGNLPATMSLPFPDFLLLILFLKAKRKSLPIVKTNLV